MAISGRIGASFDLTEAGDAEYFRIGLGFRYQLSTARSVLPETHSGLYGGYIIVDDCGASRMEAMCGGTEIAVAVLFPYDENWSVLETSQGEKISQIALLGASTVQLPQEVYVMPGGGVVFPNQRGPWGLLWSIEVGTTF